MRMQSVAMLRPRSPPYLCKYEGSLPPCLARFSGASMPAMSPAGSLVTTVAVEPAAALRGDLAVPGDKSISHRALLLGAAAEGETVVEGFGASADTLATAEALRALGVSVEVGGDVVRVAGVGLRGLVEPDRPIDCGNA